jgi:hypothetical protein
MISPAPEKTSLEPGAWSLSYFFTLSSQCLTFDDDNMVAVNERLCACCKKMLAGRSRVIGDVVIERQRAYYHHHDCGKAFIDSVREGYSLFLHIMHASVYTGTRTARFPQVADLEREGAQDIDLQNVASSPNS